MDELTTDTGLADLLLIFSVKSHLIAVRPELAFRIVVDDARPRLSFPTPLGLVVVGKSDTTMLGVWAVEGPGIGVRTPRANAADLASAALESYAIAPSRAPSAASLGG